MFPVFGLVSGNKHIDLPASYFFIILSAFCFGLYFAICFQLVDFIVKLHYFG